MGAIVRSAVSFNILDVICIGITPYPLVDNDTRLPHISHRASNQIAKTALGAEQHARFSHFETVDEVLESAHKQSLPVLALEQIDKSVALTNFENPDTWMLIVGEETQGLPSTVISKCDTVIEIYQPGPKSSLNVASASSIALYELSQ